MKKDSFFFLIPSILLLAIFATIIFGTWQYYQSNKLKKQVDLLVKENDPEDAISLYDKAHIYFFFKRGLTASYKKAQTLLRNDLATENTNSITDMQADYQAQPSLPFPSPSPLVTPIPTATPTPISTSIPTPTQQIPQKVTVPILMYHHIQVNPKPQNPVWASLYVSPDKLNEELAYLVSHNFHAITFDELYNALHGKIFLPVNPILLTFDDGWQSFYSDGFPLLKKYNMKATEFIITNYADQRYPAYLNWEQIKIMSSSGLIDFESHTKSHSFLTRLSDASLTSELAGSKEDIEVHLQKSVHWFAYPYGDYNNRVAREVQNAGFFGAVTTDYGATETLTNIYVMPRISEDGRFTLDEFTRRIASVQ